ncbi:TolB family protein [Humisphaera borealis]|uniref:Exo-alpha-sialidase n=1 Tax=Humisphaera borealis TaxID=2807512 RepID=A0A7M2WRQ3_9BACT|nr:exo-alpha-sialidase [Humisphaera borealis]QOV88156.1 exo-alpha-sialidase [Humisphaera borealis]
MLRQHVAPWVAALVLWSGSFTTLFGADANAVSLRIRFGMKDKEPTDWSGKLDVAAGKVREISGTRWTQGDSADGAAFKVQTRRQPVQGSADKQRIDNGGQMPMTDNGLVVTLQDVQPETPITFDSLVGKTTFKLSAIPMGKGMEALNGNLFIERVPSTSPLAEGTQDEDYPAIATGKNGTAYLVYLSFTRGKDFQGVRERPATLESGPNTGPLQEGPIRKIEKPQDLDYLTQPTGGEVVYLRVGRNGTWGEPIAVTDGKHEYYRPAVAVDGNGKVWVFYSAHLGADATLDHGNWELMARSFDADGKSGGAPINLSNGAGTDFMPSAATAADGRVWLAWVAGRGANFNVVTAHQEGEKFSAPARVSDFAANEWEPNVAAAADGRVAVAWDTYVKGDYDVYISVTGKDGAPGKPQAAAATAAFEGRASMAFDQAGKLWLAYEASPEMWGKDFGALKKKGAPLYQQGRYVDVRAMTPEGVWMEPAANLMDAMPETAAAQRGGKGAKGAAAKGPNPRVQTAIAPCYPRISVDSAGHVFLAFRGKPGSNWRVGVGSVWNEYLTRLDANGWSEAAWVPRSNNILDNRPAIAATGDGVLVAFSGDGRGEINPPKVGDPHQAGAEAGITDDGAAALNDPASNDDVVLVQAPPAGGEKLEPARPKKNAGRKNAGGRRAGQQDPNNDIFITTLSASDSAAPPARPRSSPRRWPKRQASAPTPLPNATTSG